jgi:hypothetical protein
MLWEAVVRLVPVVQGYVRWGSKSLFQSFGLARMFFSRLALDRYGTVFVSKFDLVT